MKTKILIPLGILVLGTSAALSNSSKQDTITSEQSPVTMNLCVADNYLNEELYSTWPKGARISKDVAEAGIGFGIGFGIGLLCPIVGLGYAL